uniref:integrin alpha-D-like n=1 Tax=Podarcis muralis TaxID=64176 RepID=UPI00109F0C7B|nr:integrin alpha-D-like [Podarcis muralis]
MDSLPLLIYLCATVLMPCHGFSLDTEQPTVFQEAALGFGQSVAQFGSGRNGGLLVGAPLQMGGVNETGKLYKCQPGPRKSGSCQEVLVQSEYVTGWSLCSCGVAKEEENWEPRLVA